MERTGKADYCLVFPPPPLPLKEGNQQKGKPKGEENTWKAFASSPEQAHSKRKRQGNPLAFVEN